MKSVAASNHPVTREFNFYQPGWSRIILLVILGYEAAGCLSGGMLLIIAPDGRLMDMPTALMNGFFSDFLIPGILLVGLGIINAFAFVSILRRLNSDWIMAGLALGGLLIWFVVEIIIIRELHWLHLMWGIPVLIGWVLTFPLIAIRHPTHSMQAFLLWCGVFSSIWYVVINFYVPIQYDGYSTSSYTVSELSAIGAPTRILWVLLCLLYSLSFSAFGWGVLYAAQGHSKLRIVGSLILVYCIVGLYWPPMHMRGHEPTITDGLHITWAILTNIFMWLFMGLGAASLNKRFRYYTIISIALHVLFGSITTIDAPNIAINGPTPTIGIWERINIGIFMLWIIVFAGVLMRHQGITSKAPHTSGRRTLSVNT